MASAQINDVWVTASTKLLQVDAVGSARVAVSVVTQVAAGAANELTAAIEGSSDGGTWFPLGAATNVGAVGSSRGCCCWESPARGSMSLTQLARQIRHPAGQTPSGIRCRRGSARAA